ncbi:hypothetical protein ACP70R_021683 [Stipagrostis hirtigluma subsp. patula]
MASTPFIFLVVALAAAAAAAATTSGAEGVCPPCPPIDASSSDGPPFPIGCVAPLSALLTCGRFLTGVDAETPAPGSFCCQGLEDFLNVSAAASAAGDGHRTLRCLCPVIHGDMNKDLHTPLDPVRMMYLPTACGVVMPPHLMPICFAEWQPKVASDNVPDVSSVTWTN